MLSWSSLQFVSGGFRIFLQMLLLRVFSQQASVNWFEINCSLWDRTVSAVLRLKIALSNATHRAVVAWQLLLYCRVLALFFDKIVEIENFTCATTKFSKSGTCFLVCSMVLVFLILKLLSCAAFFLRIIHKVHVVLFVSDACPRDEATINKDSSNCFPGRTRFCFKGNCKR